jgi:hypothetical protein
MICHELLEENYLKSKKVVYATVKAALILLNPAGGTYLNSDFEAWKRERFSCSQTTEYGKQFETARVNLGKANEELVSENNRCAMIFSKLGTNATSMATAEISRRDWHAAYLIINARYLEKGIGDIGSFEKEVDTVVMVKGQPLQEHIARLQEALKRWASVLFLSNESIRLMGNMDHTTINSLESAANSGSLTDAEILDQGFSILISHQKRYEIYEKSVRHVARFSTLIGTFKQLPYHLKLVSTFLQGLENIEKSASGLEDFQKEVEELTSENPNKKRSALQASSGDSKKPKTELHTCKFHPGREVSHTEKTCFLNPANAGKPKVNPATASASSAASSQKKATTTPCPYCTKHNPGLAKHHGEKKCWFNPASPAYDSTKTPSKRPSNSSSSKSPGMSSDFAERVGKMEDNIVKGLLAKFTSSSSSSSSSSSAKKRKGNESEDGDSN